MENKLINFAGLPKENYSDIVLTDDEMSSAIYQYVKSKYTYFDHDRDFLSKEELEEAYRLERERKQGRINLLNYSKKVSEFKPINLYKTADELYKNLLNYFVKKDGYVNLEDGRENIYKELCFYFANDSKFSGDLNKSIMLSGSVGTGKTSLMTFFQRNQNRNYNIVRTRQVAYEYKAQGVIVIEKYSNNQGKCGYCFDDLGTETSTGNYGDKLNIMLEVLLNRFDDCYNPSHITTNITLKQIKDIYGERLFDRMRANYNQFSFPLEAKSLRK